MKDQTEYPVPVYLNGKKVGMMDAKRVITFIDESASKIVIDLVSSKPVGVTSKSVSGKDTDGVHLTTLGHDEEVKMIKKQKENRKRGGFTL